MCIICVKPAGVDMPTTNILRNCWDGNTDGAGIAYWKENDREVTIDKGFMKIKQLNDKIYSLNIQVNDLAVIHFRYATHGLVDRGNCHPFPLSNRIDELRASYGVFPHAIAHNGVFGDMACHQTLSDTQKFIRGILSNDLISNHLDNKAVRILLAGYCGSSSKLAILRPSKLLLIGDFIEDNGLLYSNHGYKPVIYHKNYDDDYGDNCNYKKPLLKNECELCGEIDQSKVDYRDEFELYLCDKCLAGNNMAHG